MSFKLDFRIFAHDLGEPLRVDVRLEEELDDLEGLLLHILLLSQSCSNLLTPEKEMDGVNNPGRIKLRKKCIKLTFPLRSWIPADAVLRSVFRYSAPLG